MRRSTAGFTLIETLAVLAVLALMAGLLLGRGPARSPTAQLRAAAETIAQALRTARADAIASDAPSQVELDLPARRIRSARTTTALPAALQLSFTTVTGQAAARATIAFAPDGSASGGAISLALPPARGLVTIDVFTGRVDVAIAG